VSPRLSRVSSANAISLSIERIRYKVSRICLRTTTPLAYSGSSIQKAAMPRNLPWKTGTSSSVSRTKRSSTIPAQKRLKVAKKISSRDGENHSEKSDVDDGKHPPSPPSETFMKEGMDRDDQWRMVEDEFVTVAQRFTVHLHAAEYKRQQKAVKNRNADTISSISRPVTGKMPDHTKRRIESVARAKTQKTALKGLLDKKTDGPALSDSDDEVGLPYVGTTLHGLMDSPRRKAASLTSLTTVTKSTRAAAGFYKSAAVPTPIQKSILSPQPKRIKEQDQIKDEDVTASSDDDDDLDAPILAPQFAPIKKEPILQPSLDPKKKKTGFNATAARVEHISRTTSKSRLIEQSPERLSRPSRLEIARKRRAEEENEKTKNLDFIPTFL